jgi:hypothetical protein
MKLQQVRPSIPLHDYSTAIETAVSWLGSRYLLAAPIRPRPRGHGEAAWYVQAESWLSVRKPE